MLKFLPLLPLLVAALTSTTETPPPPPRRVRVGEGDRVAYLDPSEVVAILPDLSPFINAAHNPETPTVSIVHLATSGERAFVLASVQDIEDALRPVAPRSESILSGLTPETALMIVSLLELVTDAMQDYADGLRDDASGDAPDIRGESLETFLAAHGFTFTERDPSALGPDAEDLAAFRAAVCAQVPDLAPMFEDPRSEAALVALLVRASWSLPRPPSEDLATPDHPPVDGGENGEPDGEPVGDNVVQFPTAS